MAFNREKALAAANKYAAKKQYDRAAREYQAIVEDDPSDIRSWLMLADCLVRAGDRDGAISKYLKVANHYVKIGESQKALAVFRPVLNLDPGRLDIHIQVAELYCELGHIPDAVAAYEFVAQSYFQSGKIAEGLEGFKRVAELDHRAVGKRLRLAELYSREGMVKEAVEHFALAANRLLIDQRFDDYIRVAERLIYHKEDELPVLRTLARIYLKKNESRRALVKLNALLRAAPTDPVGLELLGDTFIALGKVDKAVSVVGELAKEQRKAGKEGLEIAARVLRKAVSWEHSQVEAMNQSLAEIEAELGKLRAAEPDEDAVMIDVSDVAADDDDGFDIDLDDSVDMGPEESAPVTELATQAHAEQQAAEAAEPAPVEEASQPEPEPEPIEASAVDEQSSEPASEEDVDTNTEPEPEPAEQVEQPATDHPESGESAEDDAAPYTPEQLEKILVEARVYVNYKMFEHALRHIRGVLAQHPEHREANELKAIILTDLKRNEDAVALYLELIARHRDGDCAYASELLTKALKLAPRNQELLDLKAALAPADVAEPSGPKKVAAAPESEDSKVRALRLGSVLRKVASRTGSSDEDSKSRPLPTLGARDDSNASPLPPLASTKGGRATSTDDSGQIRFVSPKQAKSQPQPLVSEVLELDVEEVEEVEVVEEATKPKPPPRPKPPPPRSLRGLPRRPGAKTSTRSSGTSGKSSMARLGLALGSRLPKGKTKEPGSARQSKTKPSGDQEDDSGDSEDGQGGQDVDTTSAGLPTKRLPIRRPSGPTKASSATSDQPADATQAAEPERETSEAEPTEAEPTEAAQPVDVQVEQPAVNPATEVPETSQETPEEAEAPQETADEQWPDIAEDVEELAFFIDQGFDDDARFTYIDLDKKYPGHPALDPYRAKFSSGVVTDADTSKSEADTGAPAQGDVAASGEQPEDERPSASEIPSAESVATSEDAGESAATSEGVVATSDVDSESTPSDADGESVEGASEPVATSEPPSDGRESASETVGESVDTSATSEPPSDGRESASETVGESVDASATSESSGEVESVAGEGTGEAGRETATNEPTSEAGELAGEADPDAAPDANDPAREDVGEPAKRDSEEAVPASPEEVLDALSFDESEPEPEYEDLLGDEELNEGDDFLSSIFAAPDERTTSPVADVKVPARARADLDDSADARTLFDLGTAYREMGLVDDAIQQFELAAQDPAWTARSLVMMASLHLHRGETEKAIADLGEAINCARTDVERSEARYELAVVHQTVGDPAKARELLLSVDSGYRDRDERLAEINDDLE